MFAISWPSFHVFTTQILVDRRRPISHILSFTSTQARCHTKDKRLYTAKDVASGLIDVCGWNVLVKGKEQVGKVSEIVQLGRLSSELDADEEKAYEYLMKVVQVYTKGEDEILGKRGSKTLGNKEKTLVQREFLLPIVDEFIQLIDANRRSLLISPPQGLLELASRPDSIRLLQPVLREFCQENVGILMERFKCSIKRNKKLKLNNIDNETLHDIVCRYMPTRQQLLDAGRSDLVKKIQDAGGFLFVAHSLNLMTTRRPSGFWDDLGRLDAEIEQFIQKSWIRKVHDETGFEYYENVVTKEFSMQKHAHTANGHSGIKVMPPKRVICQAARWDLHHAIILNGGYREVAHELQRKIIRTTPKSLQKRLDVVSSMIKSHS